MECAHASTGMFRDRTPIVRAVSHTLRCAVVHPPAVNVASSGFSAKRRRSVHACRSCKVAPFTLVIRIPMDVQGISPACRARREAVDALLSRQPLRRATFGWCLHGDWGSANAGIRRLSRRREAAIRQFPCRCQGPGQATRRLTQLPACPRVWYLPFAPHRPGRAAPPRAP